MAVAVAPGRRPPAYAIDRLVGRSRQWDRSMSEWTSPQAAAEALRWAAWESRLARLAADGGAVLGIPRSASRRSRAAVDPPTPRPTSAALDTTVDQSSMAAQLRSSASPSTICRRGAGLLESAAAADLLVVGARGLGAVRGLVLGSVSQACLHHAEIPVVIVRPFSRPRRTGPDRVIVGVDGSGYVAGTPSTGRWTRLGRGRRTSR